jgi:serine phosphatase RsbU (regulator of sigma subunit)
MTQDGTESGFPETGEGFVTALIIDIPDHQQHLTMVNCGHPPPLLLHRGRAGALEVPRPAPPLGLGSLAAAAYTPSVFPFEDGDLLLLYTDGVSEARDGEGGFYPLAARLEELTQDSPEHSLATINADLDAYVGRPLADDAAMIAITRGISPAASTRRRAAP